MVPTALLCCGYTSPRLVQTSRGHNDIEEGDGNTATRQRATKTRFKGNMKDFLPFVHALEHARSLELKNRREWEVWRKSGNRPAYMPSDPGHVYKHEGWQGYGHWLGTGNFGVKKDHQFWPFKEALLHARSLKLKGMREWRAWSKSDARPANIPSTPDRVYKHGGWQGWGHWLGTATVAKQDQKFLPFKEALLHARSLKLKGTTEWKAWRKSGVRPPYIPSNPNTAYKHDGWQGYGHWLGTGNQVGGKLDFLPFKKALLYARSLKLLKLTGKNDWQGGARAGHGLRIFPQPQTRSTSTRGGKRGGTGWAPPQLLPKTSSSCRSRKRCCTYAPSS